MKRMGKRHKAMKKGRGKGVVMSTMENPMVGKRSKGRKRAR